MKWLSMAAVLVMLVNADGNARMLGREGGGGFVDFSPGPVLDELKVDLGKKIRVLPPQVFAKLKVPAEWTSDRIAKVIENLEIDSSAQSLTIQSDGRLKMFEFNREKESISVLAAFFLYYGRDLTAPMRLPFSQWYTELRDVKDEIRQKLMHEVAHLWNWDDAKAFDFSKNLLLAITYDTVTCDVTERTKEGEIVHSHYMYAFGTGGFYRFHGSFNTTDNDLSLYNVDQVNGRSHMSAVGDLEITPEQLIIRARGGDYTMIINREYDDENPIWADFKNLDSPDSILAEKVECLIVYPR